jgi:hypothetical protein
MFFGIDGYKMFMYYRKRSNRSFFSCKIWNFILTGRSKQNEQREVLQAG